MHRLQITASLGWLLLVNVLGILIRWHFVTPIADFRYPWWLHSHSHMAFLGWGFNMLMLSVTGLYPGPKRKINSLWWALQLPVLGMVVSFPLTGYSTLSIVFSTLHILGSWWFAGWWFWVARKAVPTTVRIAADWALGFLFVSGLGPFGLGLVLALAPENRELYELALHFYLYFQHSGWFIFGGAAALLGWLRLPEGTLTQYRIQQLLRLGGYYVITYFIAGLLVPRGGVAAGLGMVAAASLMLITLRSLLRFQLFKTLHLFPRWQRWLIGIVLPALWLKLLLELVFLIPWVSDYVSPIRAFKIAFLHLNFLGILTPILWVTLLKVNAGRGIEAAIRWYIAGFMATELGLLFSPFLSHLQWNGYSIVNIWLWLSALMLLAAISLIFRQSRHNLSLPS